VISQTTEYALRAVVWLASHPDRPLTAQQIAEATRVPAGYLAKVLQGLSRAGLLRSQRGLGGGFTLARDPADLSLWEVVQAVDPIRRITGCPLGLELHSNRLCALHQELDDAIAQVEKDFSRCSIASLIEDRGELAPLCAVAPKGKGRAKATAKRGKR
jgi:Rrf2 family transcriptional regulator, nitric oxide-sensitive transcriptional repressor